MGDFGNKIKNIRIEKGLTQSYVAEIAGISRVAFNNIEIGKTKGINIDFGKGIAKALNIPFTELFDIDSYDTKKEINRLKVLVLQSLEKYESQQIFLKQFDHKSDDPEDWKKFELYRDHLREFKKGIFQMLESVGFCTSEDITEFYEWLHNRGKYAKPKTMPTVPPEGSDNE